MMTNEAAKDQAERKAAFIASRQTVLTKHIAAKADMSTVKAAERVADCRYCERYGKACGRDHGPGTRGDWGRDWKGGER